MRCLFMACSESAAIDAPTGRLSVFHVLEELTATSFPVMIPQLHLAAMLEKSAQDPSSTQATAMLSLNGSMVGKPMMISVDFRERDKTKVVANIQGAVLSGAGRLTVSLNYNNAMLGKWDIRVVQVRPRQAAGTPAEVQMPSASAVIQPPEAARFGRGGKAKKDEKT